MFRAKKIHLSRRRCRDDFSAILRAIKLKYWTR
jgi:hypothetical protein